MKNMAMTEAELKEQCAPSALSYGKESDGPRYPYGLCLSLEEESIQKLGLKNLPSVGQSMMITARVEITSTGEYESQHGGLRRSLSLQVTDLELGKSKKEVDLDKLYGKDGEPKSKSYSMVDQPDPDKINVKG